MLWQGCGCSQAILPSVSMCSEPDGCVTLQCICCHNQNGKQHRLMQPRMMMSMSQMLRSLRTLQMQLQAIAQGLSLR